MCGGGWITYEVRKPLELGLVPRSQPRHLAHTPICGKEDREMFFIGFALSTVIVLIIMLAAQDDRESR